MKLIVGLGNPGEKYEETKHNLGFAVLDALLQKLTPVRKTAWKEDKKSNSLIARVGDLILAKPQTFMNASGYAVKRLITNHQSLITNLWIVHDDVDLPLGKIKIVKGRGAAGHRGVESIIKELGTTDFVRFRLGIGHPGPGSSEKKIRRYVLSPFGRGDKDEARRMVKQAVKAIKTALEEGIECAMSRINQ